MDAALEVILKDLLSETRFKAAGTKEKHFEDIGKLISIADKILGAPDKADIQTLYFKSIPEAVEATYERGYYGNRVLMYLMNGRFTKLLNTFAGEIIPYRGQLDFNDVIQELRKNIWPKIADSDGNRLNNAAFVLKDCLTDISRFQKAQITVADPMARKVIQEEILGEAVFKHMGVGGRGYPEGYLVVEPQYSKEYWERVETTLKPLF